MHISLTKQQEEWIQSLIQDGHYASTSEVMRHAIRLLQKATEVRQVKLMALREAVKKRADEIEREEFSKKSVQDIIAEGKRRGA
ncbi:MAG TPA: type II toxin-antitoxin system ParD family antitoxin [Planctomicrobium sp.]|nr:type II toxin-antitoxin system ParD family antitoxin [Planctomicrobium sp.]